MVVCPSCGERVAEGLRGHFCPAVWRSCRICLERFKVSREMATVLFDAGVSECPKCSPSLHRRLG